MDKFCSRCKTTKTAQDFYVKADNKDGLRTFCKDCERAVARAKYEANPESKKAANRDWYQVNRERALMRERRHRAEHRDGINARKRAKYWSAKNEQA